MGGLLHFRKQKPAPEEESALENNVVYGAIQKQVSAQQAQDRKDKGIDIDMIDPQEIIEELEGLAHYKIRDFVDEPLKDSSGNIVYEMVPAVDQKGAIVFQDVPLDVNGAVLVMKQPLLVKQPKMCKTLVERTVNRAWAIAALGYLNKVWPTICMTPYEADTTKLRVRTAFHDIRKSMTYAEKQKFGVILRMVRDLCLARCEDMKDAQKALLLKVNRDDLRVNVSRGNNVNVGGK